MTMSELLTLDELAAFLKVSRDTVYRMAQRGIIPGVKVGSQWRFAQAEVMEELKSKDTFKTNNGEEARHE